MAGEVPADPVQVGFGECKRAQGLWLLQVRLRLQALKNVADVVGVAAVPEEQDLGIRA